jgi:hypothetical protein
MMVEFGCVDPSDQGSSLSGVNCFLIFLFFFLKSPTRGDVHGRSRMFGNVQKFAMFANVRECSRMFSNVLECSGRFSNVPEGRRGR